MELLSIGTFAALTRLSPKALRHYDELDLLTPAHVDPVTARTKACIASADAISDRTNTML